MDYIQNLLNNLSALDSSLLDSSLLALIVILIVTRLRRKTDGNKNPNGNENLEGIVYYNKLYNHLFSYAESQIQRTEHVFKFSIVTSICGFVIICYAIVNMQNDTVDFSGNLIIILAGSIIELCGLLTLFIYRSLSRQTKTNLMMLERLTNIKMSDHFIQEMPKENDPDKGSAYIELAKSLIEAQRILLTEENRRDKIY